MPNVALHYFNDVHSHFSFLHAAACMQNESVCAAEKKHFYSNNIINSLPVTLST